MNMLAESGAPAPIADSPEDVLTRTIPLDGGTAIVEHVGDRVEVTIRLGDRIVCALALSRAEASALGMAVARAKLSAEAQGIDLTSNFVGSHKVSASGPKAKDYKLTRLAAYLVAMNADASTLARAWGTAQPA